MAAPLKVDIICLFPEMLTGFLENSMMRQAVKRGAVEFNLVPLRDFTEDIHQTTDDRPFGGGPGMVLKAEPLAAAIRSVKTPESRVLFMTPQGTPFKQPRAEGLAKEQHLIFICGHYEGIDQRIRDGLIDEEISLGDYVLTNGILPAAVVIDAVVRLLPGVLGGEGATEAESFTTGMLDFPQYTRPAVWEGQQVPDILLSGDHGAIADWRAQQAQKRTQERRPDLLEGEN